MQSDETSSTKVEPSTSVYTDEDVEVEDDEDVKVDASWPLHFKPTWIRSDFQPHEPYSSPDPKTLPPLTKSSSQSLAIAIADKLKRLGELVGPNKAVVAGSGALWLYKNLAESTTPDVVPTSWRPGDIDIFFFGIGRTAMRWAVQKFAASVDGLRKKHPHCKTIYDVHFNPEENIPPFSFVSAPRLAGTKIVSHFDISVTRVLIPLTDSQIEGFDDFEVEPEVQDHIRDHAAVIHPLRGLLDPRTGKPREYLDDKMIQRCRKYQERGYTFVFGAHKEDLYGRCKSSGAKAMAQYVLAGSEVKVMQDKATAEYTEKMAKKKRERDEERAFDEELEEALNKKERPGAM